MNLLTWATCPPCGMGSTGPCVSPGGNPNPNPGGNPSGNPGGGSSGNVTPLFTISRPSLWDCAASQADAKSLAAISRIQGDNLLGKMALDVLGNDITEVRNIWNTLTRKDTGGAEAYTVIALKKLKDKGQEKVLTKALQDYSKPAEVALPKAAKAAKVVGWAKIAYDGATYIYSFGECSFHDLGLVEGW